MQANKGMNTFTEIPQPYDFFKIQLYLAPKMPQTIVG